MQGGAASRALTHASASPHALTTCTARSHIHQHHQLESNPGARDFDRFMAHAGRFRAKSFISISLAFRVPAGSAAFMSPGGRPPLRS